MDGKISSEWLFQRVTPGKYATSKKRCITPGAPDIREFTRDAIPDKDAQGGEGVSPFRPDDDDAVGTVTGYGTQQLADD